MMVNEKKVKFYPVPIHNKATLQAAGLEGSELEVNTMNGLPNCFDPNFRYIRDPIGLDEILFKWCERLLKDFFYVTNVCYNYIQTRVPN